MITTIGLDADDTLWHNETFFRLTQARFAQLLEPFAPADTLHQQLLAAEWRNLGDYGYGVKGFTLSMIETAIEVSKGTVDARVIAEILSAGREMLAHPIELLPHVFDTITQLSQRYQLLLITKGDLLDQERKLAQSGLGDLFHGVEIVSEKTAQAYEKIAQKYGARCCDMVMVGNSMKSDVLPMIAAGGYGVHIPYAQTWELERAEAPQDQTRFVCIQTLADLPYVVDRLSAPHN